MINIRIVSLVEALCIKYPNIEASSQGPEYKDIEWADNYPAISKEALESDVLEISKLRAIDSITKVIGEQLELYKLFLAESSLNIQSQVYDMKATAAKDVLANYDALQRAGLSEEAIMTAIVKPPILAGEAEMFGLTVVQLSNIVIQMYNRAQGYMGTYIGLCEAWRRLCKTTINAAETVEALASIELTPVPTPPKVDPSDYTDSTKDYMQNFKSLM